MASTADNWGLYPTGCGSCSNSDRYESRLRLARLDVDKEKLDWYYEQEKWFGQSTAIAYGDWGTNDIFKIDKHFIQIPNVDIFSLKKQYKNLYG